MPVPDDPKNPDRGVKPAAPTTSEPAPSGLRSRLASAPPPAFEVPATQADLVRALASCPHPHDCRSPAVVLEPDGSRLVIAWCGACGAVQMPGDDNGVWIKPGLVLLCSELPTQ